MAFPFLGPERATLSTIVQPARPISRRSAESRGFYCFCKPKVGGSNPPPGTIFPRFLPLGSARSTQNVQSAPQFGTQHGTDKSHALLDESYSYASGLNPLATQLPTPVEAVPLFGARFESHDRHRRVEARGRASAD